MGDKIQIRLNTSVTISHIKFNIALKSRFCSFITMCVCQISTPQAYKRRNKRGGGDSPETYMLTADHSPNRVKNSTTSVIGLMQS